MLLDLSTGALPSPSTRAPLARSPFFPAARSVGVDSEYGRLGSVLLADPRHLSLVPCNSVSCASMEAGRSVHPGRAERQHAGLVAALRGEEVEVKLVPADAGLPDLAFTRDTSLMTPWGLLGLRPGAAHRSREVDAVLEAAAGVGLTRLGRIERGRIEGGDVAILRPGLLVIGLSGERTDEEGAAALGALFRARGWQVLTTRIDPVHLHLDTLFCLADRDLALACTEVLDPEFIRRMEQTGIGIVAVTPDEVRQLGCNILALGDRRVVTAGSCSRVDAELARRGYRAIGVDLSEFTMCGGGVHCLTMPLRRARG